MKRIIFVVLFSIVLFGCNSQETIPERETFKWIFSDGTIIEFPSNWQIQPNYDLFESLFIQDEYGIFYLAKDARSHQATINYFLQADDAQEFHAGRIRVYFQSVEIENQNLIELFGGVSETAHYTILAPDDKVITLILARTDNLDERLSAILNVINRSTSLTNDYRIFSYFGGLATMIYPDEFDIVNSMGAYSPEFRSENHYITTLARHEAYWLSLFDDSIDTDNIEDKDIIGEMLFAYTQGEEVPLDSLNQLNHLNHVITVYDAETYTANSTRYYTVYIFKLDSDIWFRMSIRNFDNRIVEPEETEAIIMRMIDSILLNNRDSYYEPIELVLPD